MAAKKNSKIQLPLSEVPHPCTILAVDPGEDSGWSLWSRGVLRAHGHCSVWDTEALTAVIGQLYWPRVAVVERPFRVRFGTQTNIGTADRIWRHHLEVAGLGRRIVRVYPSTWRSRALGSGYANARRDDARARELVVAAELAGAPVEHPDEAAAICIGAWARTATEVWDKLPKRAQRG